MDRRFATLTASLSVLMFGGVWIAMTPRSVSAAADLRETVATALPTETASIYYPGCDAVRAAGKAPLFRDQPGYRAEMDGDGDADGIACEPHRTGGYAAYGDFGSVRTDRAPRPRRR